MPPNPRPLEPRLQSVLDAKRGRLAVEATNRWKAKRQQMTPEQGFALVHQLLSTHGPMTKRDLGQRTKLFGATLDAALSHGVNQGHFTMEPQQTRPQRGGRQSEVWSIAPQQEQPEQLSLYDECELPPPVQPANSQPMYAPKKRLYVPPAPRIHTPPEQPTSTGNDSEDWGYSRYADAPPDSQPTNVPQHVQNIQDAARKPNFKHYLESYLGSLSGPEYAHTVRALGASPSQDEDPHGDIFRRLVSKTPPDIQPTQRSSGRPLSPEKQQLAQLNAEHESPIGHKDPREVRLLHLSGGMKGVFKPRNGEHPLRFSISPGTHYRREAAASAVADVIGMSDLVPPTTVRDHNGEIGSIQQFMDGDIAARAPRGSEYDGHTDAARAAVFDYLIGNTDRHLGNWLISPQGKLVLIDHGLSFPTEHDAADNDTNTEIFENAIGSRLRMPDLTPLAGKWPEIEAELHHHGIEPEAIAHTKKRYDAVMSGQSPFVAHLPHPSTL